MTTLRTSDYAGLPDSALVRMSCDGDKRAYGTLVERYRKWVVGIAYANLLSTAGDTRQNAEDVGQSVFVDVYRGLAKGLRAPDNFRAYVARAARNRASSLRLAERRGADAGFEVDADLDVDAVVLRGSVAPQDGRDRTHDVQKLLNDAIARLNPDLREALLMRFASDPLTPFREIAHALGIEINAAEKRVTRALQALRVHFERTGRTRLVQELGYTSLLTISVSADFIRETMARVDTLAARARHATLATVLAPCVAAGVVAALVLLSGHAGEGADSGGGHARDGMTYIVLLGEGHLNVEPEDSRATPGRVGVGGGATSGLRGAGEEFYIGRAHIGVPARPRNCVTGFVVPSPGKVFASQTAGLLLSGDGGATWGRGDTSLEGFRAAFRTYVASETVTPRTTPTALTPYMTCVVESPSARDVSMRLSIPEYGGPRPGLALGVLVNGELVSETQSVFGETHESTHPISLRAGRNVVLIKAGAVGTDVYEERPDSIHLVPGSGDAPIRISVGPGESRWRIVPEFVGSGMAGAPIVRDAPVAGAGGRSMPKYGWVHVSWLLDAGTIYALHGSHGQLYAATYNGVWEFSERDMGWTRTDEPLGHTARVSYGLATYRGALYSARDGGVYRRDPDTGSWEARSVGIEDRNVHAIASVGDMLLAGTYTGHIYTSDDGGRHWSLARRTVANTGGADPAEVAQRHTATAAQAL